MRLFDLFEVTADDAYPKQFQEFRKKYARIPAAKKSKLFVQFTNHKDNTIDKNAFQSPVDHNDFVGTYGYPLDYILKHPMDVWYAHDTKFIRILHAKDSGNVLDLTGMSDQTAKRLVNMVPYQYKDPGYDSLSFLKQVIKANGIKGKNRWSRAFITIVQNDLNDDCSINQVRSGKLQSEIIRSMGYGTILDRAKSQNSASINDREPEQIIFLSRNQFDIIDIFNIHNDEKIRTSTSGYDVGKDEKYLRKVAAKVFSAIGTKLVDRHPDKLWPVFWSKRGERLAVTPEHTSSSLLHGDLKMGQKPHRYFDDTNADFVKINLYSTHGHIRFTSTATDSIDDIASNVKRLFDNNDEDENFKPETKDEYVKAKEEEENRSRNEYYNDQKKNAMTRDAKIYNREVRPILEKTGYEDILSYASDEEKQAKILKLIEMVSNIKQGETFEDYLKHFRDIQEKSPDIADSIDKEFFMDLPENILNDVGRFINMVIEFNKTEFFSHAPRALYYMKNKV